MSLFKRDQVVSVVLMLPRIDARLVRHVPRGISIDSAGSIAVDGYGIAQDLFRIPRNQLENWTKQLPQGLVFWFHGIRNPDTGEWLSGEIDSIDEALGAVAQSLLHNGHPMDRLRKYKYYIMAREDLKVYLIIVGDLSDPPVQAIVGRLRG